MARLTPEDLLARHEAFLDCAPVTRPLLGFWLGGYYPAEQFPRGTAAWKEGQPLRPEDVTFAPFAADYEQLFRLHLQAEDDFFYVGSAYWGMPWLEAILGCPVFAAGANCRAEPCLNDLAALAGRYPATGQDGRPEYRRLRGPSPSRMPARLEGLEGERLASRPRSLADDAGLMPDLDRDPWFAALLRFTENLVAFAAGRFPVCPPLLRGPGDCASALLGGIPFVTGFIDDPAGMQALLNHCAQTRLDVRRRLQEVIPSWHGTHAAGGYPSKVWGRRTVAYNQDDAAALLSPKLFREFLLPLEREQCQAAAVTFIHLHSSCLYPVDLLLEDRSYNVLEINIDHPGGSSPALPQLLPTLARIQAAGRPLLLWGELTPGEWRSLRQQLSPVGLSLQPIVQQAADMPALLEALQ